MGSPRIPDVRPWRDVVECSPAALQGFWHVRLECGHDQECRGKQAPRRARCSKCRVVLRSEWR